MNFIVEKPKVRQGLSYVLKSSAIQNALMERRIDVPVYLTFFTPQHFNPADTPVFESEYVPVSVGGKENRFHVRIGVVISEQRKQVEELFVREMLVPFLDFVEYQLSKPQNSTDRGRGFYVRWVDGKLVF